MINVEAVEAVIDERKKILDIVKMITLRGLATGNHIRHDVSALDYALPMLFVYLSVEEGHHHVDLSKIELNPLEMYLQSKNLLEGWIEEHNARCDETPSRGN